ncbi:MAG: DUF4320 family protein [Thermincola sp.]|nr:DUF4320 family protein [Thermincola sp.]
MSWSKNGRLQLNEEFTVTFTLQTDIGYSAASEAFLSPLKAQASGKSEVYWK